MWVIKGYSYPDFDFARLFGKCIMNVFEESVTEMTALG
jgi:hypothetical protein